MDPIIKIENLGKSYFIGHEKQERYTALRDVVVDNLKGWGRGVKQLFQKGNRPIIKGDEIEEFWALKDVSFEIKKGEAVGIIGRNGAGKSTLLKLFSRITEPTTGRIEINGRVASLLEVGTGFSPELTGRENIYLNGAILGMGRQEIKRKFDEIVDFSGVEKFLDTPVKRYSSGMYVRLAFAVAAHLEPDILIVDEVLAVGDAQFQKKCLGKMNDISKGEGRTVIFVSHNMNAVNTLCNKGIILNRGELIFEGSIDTAINKYLEKDVVNFGKVDFTDKSKVFERSGSRNFSEILSIGTKNNENEYTDTFIMGSTFNCEINVLVKNVILEPEIGICISTINGSRLHHLLSKWEKNIIELLPGKYLINICVPVISLYPGNYTITTWVRAFKSESSDDFIESPLTFTIIQSKEFCGNLDFDIVSASGGVFTKALWNIEKL